MANYKIIFKKSAHKALDDIQKKDLERIIAKIKKLEVVPRPIGSMKLTNQEKYRIRQGNYRIIYGIDEEKKIITVVKIGHRKEIYL